MTACIQPGCAGSIEDGYCNVCGVPADAPVAPTPLDPALIAARSAAGSTRLATAAIGSSRSGTGSVTTRRLPGASTRVRSARLGAGITTVPSEPITDPMTAVMLLPEVPEAKRFCSACGAAVGRSRDGNPGRSEGFCAKCRSPFSFSPKLQAGDLVGGQYEVAGCLAHGGLGWIYLARDKNVSNRYVVLKGLLNAGDADAYQAAITERQFLAEVEHPLILEIYNFVLHDGAGYIVMEYVGGKSLKGILKDRMRANNGVYDPIPVDQACAYIIEILPAFAYLHASGLLYCDMKPDNVIQQGDAVKLIDLGGVRRIDDTVSAIYGTVGYQAPEVPDVGPSVAGDIYTIGRTLAMLAIELRGYQTTFSASLPPVDEVPLFQVHDSFYRLLLKATATNPDDRFQSADELRDQLIGVLREAVAASNRTTSQSHRSVLFEAPSIASDTLRWEHLPNLRVDGHDPMATWLDAVSVPDPAARLDVLYGAPEHTIEVHLALIRAAIEAAQHKRAEDEIAVVLADDPWEWRAVWLQGVLALALGDYDAAIASFNAVYGQTPGELAPKLALALACENIQPEAAERLYLVCARTDANYSAPAAFGLARIRGARGDVLGALDALDLVTPTSRSYVEARRQRAALLVRSDQGLPSLAAAVDSIATVSIDPADRQQLVIEVLEAALAQVELHGPDRTITIAGFAADENGLRDGVEAAYRELAGMTSERAERVRLVDAANGVRRWSLT